MKKILIFIAVAILVLPAVTFAAGGHDALSCTGCHSLHQAKTTNFILAVEPNTKDVNPRTNQPFAGSTAICLGCHQTPEKGGHGMTAISGKSSHPYDLTSINAKIATVPDEFLRNGRFECTSCHNPHPSNANPKYLRVDTGGAYSMADFCALCHPAESDSQMVNEKRKAQKSTDEGQAGSQEGKPAQTGKKRK